VAQATPPACTTQFQYDCAAATLGGYTVITPLASTGQTQIEGFNASNAVVFNQTLPIPPVGSAASDVPTQQAVLQADALLAAQSGQASTLPACGSPPCLALNPGGSLVITNSTTSSYVAQDSVVSQLVNQYSTTLKATLGSQTVFEQTYAAAFSDPAVQAAVSAADGILTADHATPGAPAQASSSTGLQSSQSSYVLTGDTAATGAATPSTTTFGPAAIAVGDNQTEVFIVLAGQEDINVNVNTEYFADRNIVTTDTYLTTQTYTIQGTGGIAYSACDINRDGVVNVLDVQDILKQASGASPPGASDLNGDGVVDVVDIEFVIDAILGYGCAAVNPGTSSVTATAVRSLPSMAVDAVGNRYIVDPGANRIRKLSADGTLSTVVVVGLDHPAGVAVDAAGNLYVTDSGSHRVFKLFAGTITTVGERR
jgi:hypothetical protein